MIRQRQADDRPGTEGLLPFRFETYTEREFQRIAGAVRALDICSQPKVLAAQRTIQPLRDAWAKGSSAEVLAKLDEVTCNTKTIGERFLHHPPEDQVPMKSFHWEVEHPDPNLRSMLHVGLCLVPADPQFGRLTLTQEILRTGEDSYIYWGVD